MQEKKNVYVVVCGRCGNQWARWTELSSVEKVIDKPRPESVISTSMTCSCPECNICKGLDTLMFCHSASFSKWYTATIPKEKKKEKQKKITLSDFFFFVC